MKNAEQELEEQQMKKEQEMGQDQGDNIEKQHKTDGYKEYIKSLITFNKGGDWKRQPECRDGQIQQATHVQVLSYRRQTPGYSTVTRPNSVPQGRT